MNALQGMNVDQFIIIAPTFLVVTYLLITVQKKLCNGRNVKMGLIIPIIFFVVATVLAFRPLFIVDSSGTEGMVAASLMVWMTFNIPTLALLFPFLMAIKNKKEAQYLQEAMEARQKAEAESLNAETAQTAEELTEETVQ